MSKPDDATKPPRVQVRLVWRLVFCLGGPLLLLIFLAIYLVLSLNSVRHFTPIIRTEETQLESLDLIPALLGSADTERRAYEKSGDPHDLTLYQQARRLIESSLASLNTPLLLPSENEAKRRDLVRQWLAKVGDVTVARPPLGPPSAALQAESDRLLDQIDSISRVARAEMENTLTTLQQQEDTEAKERVNLMWSVVGGIIFITIPLQLLLSNSIIGPIQALGAVVRRLQAGDFTVRAHIRSGDEIQNLAETFNAMAENILRNQQALQETNSRLEERVVEKTEQIQQTLAEAEAERAKLQTLIERMPDGLLLLDTENRIVLINDAALTILGHRDIASLQGWLTGDPGVFSFRQMNQQAVTGNAIPYRRIARGETFSNLPLYLRGWDNATRLVSFSGAPVLAPDGTVELSLLILRDVTQDLALQQELEDKNQKLSEAARLKDEFLATLSHELRTPLTPVISCAHLLDSDESLDPDQRKNVRVIDRNARALSRMIDELLDLSAVMNRKLRLTRETMEMNEWTRTTLETMRPAWEKKKLSVAFLPAALPVELEIDPTRLAQVLTNLINNAIKYTDPNGTITVKVIVTDDEVRIAVGDSGVGLNRHEIDLIFEMFHQARTQHTRSVGGLGVGLTVARSLAELHGGGLLADSEGPGHGSTFTIWLPRSRDLAAVDFSTPLLSGPATTIDRKLLRGRRILLVEDSTDTREALERIFRRRECHVVSASSGEEAYELALREPPEIVISDIGLPGMSGIDLIRKMRQNGIFGGMIAVVLSGLGREQDIKSALDAGFDAHLLKPVEIAILDRTLANALAKKTLAGA